MSRQVVWFSCGAPSAVLAKLCPDAELVYCDTRSEHPDNLRFLRDVEEWTGRRVTILASDKYHDTWDVWAKKNFILGPRGAPCTVELKKKLRYSYQRPDDVQMFGYHIGEEQRAANTIDNEPGIDWQFPLIDRGLTKSDCLAIIDRAGIELPWMYQHGYPHNNCLGCPKGGTGYWNAIRRDFPVVFLRMAGEERRLGYATHKETVETGEFTTWVDDDGEEHARPVKVTRPLFLDELDPDRGDMKAEGEIECSILCQIAENEIEADR